jgi:hypothetical protein
LIKLFCSFLEFSTRISLSWWFRQRPMQEVFIIEKKEILMSQEII